VIPVDVAEITPEWMSGALERDVRTVTVLDQHSGTTGRALVGLEYGNASDAGPDTAFVKLAPFDPQQRAFVDQVGLGIAEARFYREIAHRGAGSHGRATRTSRSRRAASSRSWPPSTRTSGAMPASTASSRG
jgi:hypothetical protein